MRTGGRAQSIGAELGVQHRGASVTGGHGNISAVKCEAKRVWA